MNVKSRKGATMVEAALIFPLVIGAVAAVILIVINMYLSLWTQTSLHLALRRECGELSRTVSRQEMNHEFPWRETWVGIRPVVAMEEEREYRMGPIFTGSAAKTEAGRAYVIDEAELIRIFTFDTFEKEGS